MRLNPYARRPEVYDAIRGVSRALAQGPVEPSLRALVEVRVSQLNRCGFCLAMHADGARAAGVEQAALDGLAGWREGNAFTPRERAALRLAELMTETGSEGVPAAAWDEAAQVFTEDELSDLLFVIGLVNLFNRVNVAVQFPAAAWREGGAAGVRDARP